MVIEFTFATYVFIAYPWLAPVPKPHINYLFKELYLKLINANIITKKMKVKFFFYFFAFFFHLFYYNEKSLKLFKRT